MAFDLIDCWIDTRSIALSSSRQALVLRGYIVKRKRLCNGNDTAEQPQRAMEMRMVLPLLSEWWIIVRSIAPHYISRQGPEMFVVPPPFPPLPPLPLSPRPPVRRVVSVPSNREDKNRNNFYLFGVKSEATIHSAAIRTFTDRDAQSMRFVAATPTNHLQSSLMSA